MRKKLENVYSVALSKTFKAINPIKKTLVTTDCKVHLFIQKYALNILKYHGYKREYDIFKAFLPQINQGLVWADSDFKSYYHFYNPKTEMGRVRYDNNNALLVTQKYYNKALKFFAVGNYDRGMFYFGASCHLIQDLTIPQHAKGRLLDNHRQFETYVKENYNKINRLKSSDEPICLYSVKEYVDYNALNALKTDQMYRDISDLNTRFYLTAVKSVVLAQKSSAGFMLMFYRDLMKK